MCNDYKGISHLCYAKWNKYMITKGYFDLSAAMLSDVIAQGLGAEILGAGILGARILGKAR